MNSIVKTEKTGWVKSKDVLVNTDKTSLESYKKQKETYKRLKNLEDELSYLKKILVEKGIING